MSWTLWVLGYSLGIGAIAAGLTVGLTAAWKFWTDPS